MLKNRSDWRVWRLTKVRVNRTVPVEGFVSDGFFEEGLDDSGFTNPGETDNPHRFARASYKFSDSVYSLKLCLTCPVLSLEAE